jgi:hypothetical protein
MQQSGQSSEATGTRDDTYDVISVVYHALQGAENCEIYADDAEDEQLRSFFQSACDQQRQLAEQGKQVLAQCLQKDSGSSGGGQSAFFGQGSSGSSSSSSQQSETVTSGAGQTGGGIG